MFWIWFCSLRRPSLLGTSTKPHIYHVLLYLIWKRTRISFEARTYRENDVRLILAGAGSGCSFATNVNYPKQIVTSRRPPHPIPAPGPPRYFPDMKCFLAKPHLSIRPGLQAIPPTFNKKSLQVLQMSEEKKLITLRSTRLPF